MRQLRFADSEPLKKRRANERRAKAIKTFRVDAVRSSGREIFDVTVVIKREIIVKVPVRDAEMAFVDNFGKDFSPVQDKALRT